MRNLFLLLALANLGALAVFAWVLEPPDPPPAYDGPSITLLRELDPAAPISRSLEANVVSSDQIQGQTEEVSSSVADNSLATESVATDDGNVIDEPAGLDTSPGPIVAANDRAIGAAFGECISIGPFADVAEAAAASLTLIDAGFEPRRTTREDEVWDGYWVYIETIEDFAAAEEIQTELADNGLDDTQIISNAEGRNLLSIGVFSEITRAGAQAERVNRIGYEATIADNMATRETQWLDVDLTSEQSIEMEMLQAPGRISRLEILTCTGIEND